MRCCEWPASASFVVLLLSCALLLYAPRRCHLDARMEEIVHASLQQAVGVLVSERDALQTENEALRLRVKAAGAPNTDDVRIGRLPHQLSHLLPSTSTELILPQAPVVGRRLLTQGPPLLCGNSALPVRLRTAVEWRNRHGRFVSRTATVCGRSLFVCKHAPGAVATTAAVTTLEVPLGPATPAELHDGTELRLRPASGPPVELRLISQTEARRWLNAVLSLPFERSGGSEAAGTPNFAGSAATPGAQHRQSSRPRKEGDARRQASGEGTRKCHARALRYGAHTLEHQAPLPTAEQQAKFGSSCAVASSASDVRPPDSDSVGEVFARVLPPAQSARRYLLVDRTFCHGLGHELLVYNLGLRIALHLNLTHVHLPLLSHAGHGDHPDLASASTRLDALLGIGRGQVAWKELEPTAASLRTHWLSRPCPVGSKKHRGRDAASWGSVRAAVRKVTSGAALFRMCGDVKGVSIDGPAAATKYSFAATGAWWRHKLVANRVANPAATRTPLFNGDGGHIHVAVHIRRGDMVYRNFYWQLAPDSYFVSAMQRLLAVLGTGSHAAPTVVFHVFTERPLRESWTGRPKVPLAAPGTEYVDEYGCVADLRVSLDALLKRAPSPRIGVWQLRLHVDVDTITTLWHMARADVLIASDSSFSLAASIFSEGVVLGMEQWRRYSRETRRGIRFVATTKPDGSFDCGKLLGLRRVSAHIIRSLSSTLNAD